ncbi:MAG TPA: glycosyltransferase family 8 protein [Streptosporangiaceae bacterium]|jgi:UDP-D-galactose:(glucosyl)LPS alpha-1,3-D-galactosyltransferase
MTSDAVVFAPIVCCVDDGFIQPLCVLMQSIATAQPDATADIKFIVIHQGLQDTSRRTIHANADRLGLSVEFRRVPAPDSRYPEFRTGSDATYTRLAIPDVIPDYRVVLYMDVDIILLQDIRPLLRMPLNGAPFAAVPDPTKPVLRLGRALPGWEALGLKGDREYFNNGVMLIDIAECRRRGLFAKAARLLVDHQENLRYWDQDAMNLAATEDWLRLERKWNTFAFSSLVQLGGYVHRGEPLLPLSQLLAEEETAAVLHFAGPQKPWLPDYPDNPLRDRYLQLLRMITTPADNRPPAEKPTEENLEI